MLCHSASSLPKTLASTGQSIRGLLLGRTSVMSVSPFNYSYYTPSSQIFSSVTMSKSYASSFSYHLSEGQLIRFGFSRQKRSIHWSLISGLLNSSGRQLMHLGLSSRIRYLSFRLSLPKNERVSRFNWSVKPATWILGGSSAGICVCFSSSEPVHAEAANDDKNNKAAISTSHGKKVYTDYSIMAIPGDGRCMFRSVAHGACIRSGKGIPDEKLQRQLADELRAQVADEFIKRRSETEWFIEGSFDMYVSNIRKPHVWGGEPELLMASHVLQMPITVYMHDNKSGGLIAIAEYGQEYGKENPIRVLYHGFGHYESLQIPGRKGAKSRL